MRTNRDLGDELVSRGIKLRQLALLVAVQRSGQLSLAAALMNITQPAASRLLADLERIVGAQLSQRHSRGITLTPAGERLAERARSMLRDLDLAGREVRDINRGSVGSVHVGSVTGPSLDLVLPVVRSLERSEPYLRFKIEVTSSDRLVAGLLSGNLDLYIGRVPEGIEASQFDTIPIGAEPLSLVVRRDHPLARRKGLTLEECLPFDWVMQPTGSMLCDTVERYLTGRGLALPSTVISTGSLMLSFAFVMRSQAVAVMSSSAARLFSEAGEGGPVTELDVVPGLSVPAYSIVTLRDREPTPAAQIFLKVLEEELRGRGA
ncbi:MULTISPECIES: LysR family transcriptional regulator [Paracoccus]|uniref:LysR family transcriptional regulator n=1 Tax=Paracoccus litorisediminis TaxID=2006130 RepID=A0A844HLQ6_9RHOB|nr:MULTISPECIES: LysR substrate-binding domain-containing protein [Paracoccus]MBD9528171.1 LysR family transcriptional regulator [Paracoccus sp. PAR01]MTH59125.1 LysR family transcriptional regulator [Paracoccus litorisediminis]